MSLSEDENAWKSVVGGGGDDQQSDAQPEPINAIYEAAKLLDLELGLVENLDGTGFRVGMDLKPLALLDEFMRLVLDTDGVPYKISLDAKGKANITAGKLSKYVTMFSSFSTLVIADVILPPHFKLFQIEYENHPVRYLCGGINVTDRHGCEVINDFIVTLRAGAVELKIRHQLRQWSRNAKERIKRLNTYMDSLFDRHQQLMVMQVDFMYRQAACGTVDEARLWQTELLMRNAAAKHDLLHGLNSDSEPSTFSRVSILAATEDWRHFKDNMRRKRSLFKNLVGCVCFIKYSAVGGFSLQVYFLFNSVVLPQYEWLAQEIGRYGVELSAGRWYFHANQCGKVKYRTTGLIDQHDTVKRAELMQALTTRIMKDLLVRIIPALKSKRVMTGHLPAEVIARKKTV